MKKKIFIFIGIITLCLSLLVVTPKTKAQVKELYTDYDLIVIEIDGNDIHFLWFEGGGLYPELVYNVSAIMVRPLDLPQPLSYYYEGQRFKLHYIDEPTLVVTEVSEIRNFDYYTTIKEVNDVLVYLSSTDTDYYFFLIKTREMFIFKKSDIDLMPYWDLHPVLQVPVPLKSGTLYFYRDAFDDYYPMSAESIAYQLGYYDAYTNYDSELQEAYQRGYDNALLYLEDFRELAVQEGYSQAYNEYFPQIQTQYWNGYTVGRSQGYDDGYNTAIDSFDEEGIYQTAFDDGYLEGVKDKQEENTQSFYDGLQKWLVPAIITVIVLGGIFAFIRKKGEN